jgi:hypothetical protein
MRTRNSMSKSSQARDNCRSTFDLVFSEWLPEAQVAELRIARERIDLAILMIEDRAKADEAAAKLQKKEAREARRALRIKAPRKERSDKGTRRKPRSDTPTDQVTE